VLTLFFHLSPKLEQQGWGSGSELGRAILSQEIGAYGTSTDSAQQQETDRMYDSTFQSDPGHISRAELRFNAALRAAGVSRGGMALTTRRRRTQERPPAKPVLKSSPASGSDWVAYPDGQGRAKEDVTINIYGKQQQLRASGPPHRASPRRMSASEARRDLFGYFDGISSQVADQERKHARLMLDRLGSGRRGRQGGDEAGARGRTAAKKDATSMSILRLLSKAMKSDA
jgi:hypothetical protein